MHRRTGKFGAASGFSWAWSFDTIKDCWIGVVAFEQMEKSPILLGFTAGRINAVKHFLIVYSVVHCWDVSGKAGAFLHTSLALLPPTGTGKSAGEAEGWGGWSGVGKGKTG